MRKPASNICKNKDTDQLCNNCTADRNHLTGFPSWIVQSLFLKSVISSLWHSSIPEQISLCWKTQKTGFLMLWLT